MVRVDRQQGIDGAWEAARNNRLTRLDATGDEATLIFLERSFILRGAGAVRGTLSDSSVHLKTGVLELWLDRERIRVRWSPTRELIRPFENLPRGRRIVLDGDGLHIR
jgi:hypothetical protein